MMAVVPPGEANKRHILICKLGPCIGLPVIRRHPKVGDAEACFKTFLANEPPRFRGALLFCERPSVEPCWHQRLVPRKVYHGANTEGGNELTAANGL